MYVSFYSAWVLLLMERSHFNILAVLSVCQVKGTMVWNVIKQTILLRATTGTILAYTIMFSFLDSFFLFLCLLLNIVLEF